MSSALGIDYQIPRNALVLLMVAQALVVAPMVPHVSPWIVAIGVLAVYWRWMVYQGRWDYPRRGVKLLLVIGSAIGIVSSDAGAFTLETAANLLIVSFALKLIEMKSRRDAYLVIFLAYFVIATGFLFDQSMVTAAYQVAAFVGVTAAMVGLNQLHTRVRPLQSLRLAAALVLQALPLTVVLFLFFPRVAPLWSVPMPGGARTGITDQTTPGDIARLAQSDEIAFRAVFEGEVPGTSALYWRGMVYSEFENGTWSASPASTQEPAVERSAPAFYPELAALPYVTYQVLLEPTQSKWLFALDVPVPQTRKVFVQRDYRLESEHPVTALTRYAVKSYPAATMDRELPRWLVRRETQVPPADNPRAVEFARDLYARSNGDAEFVSRLLDWIRREEYVYTLEPPMLARQNSIDQFWFESRRGFCAHYAGAFVFMVRSVGVPARMVGGYLGGEINPVTGHLVVRQYDAHAWAEIWLEGAGWTRVDPTAAVAPNRIERGFMEALSREDRAALSALVAARLDRSRTIADLMYFFESVEHRWNLWVVGYDAALQSRYLADLLGEITPARIGLALLAGGSLSLVLVVATMFWRRRPDPTHPAMRAFKRFAARLARHGARRSASESPSAFVIRVAREQGLEDAQTDALVELLERLLYNPAADEGGEELVRLRRGLRRFTLQLAFRSNA